MTWSSKYWELCGDPQARLQIDGGLDVVQSTVMHWKLVPTLIHFQHQHLRLPGWSLRSTKVPICLYDSLELCRLCIVSKLLINIKSAMHLYLDSTSTLRPWWICYKPKCELKWEIYSCHRPSVTIFLHLCYSMLSQPNTK